MAILFFFFKTESPSLENIDVSDNNMGDDGIMFISVAIKTCKLLKSLVNLKSW